MTVPSEASKPEERASLCRRANSSLQLKKHNAQKEKLARKRVDLLDDNKDHRDKKRNLEVVEDNKSNESEIVTENPKDGEEVEKSAYVRVKETLRLYNKYYLHFIQEEENRCKNPNPANEDNISAKRKIRRPDLKATSKMIETKSIMYPEKRIGDLPGIDIGHQFYSRAEMVAIGIHSHWLNGIDYMGAPYKKKYSKYAFPLAVAIVLSGKYEDDNDNAEEIVYTGQGGNDLLGGKHQMRDQVMKYGNLGLKNCAEYSVPVRVIRGHKSGSSYAGTVYTYDGLYNVVKFRTEKGKSGFSIFKFFLKRLDGQQSLKTDKVNFLDGRVPRSVLETRGLVCSDISGGIEKIPIVVTNLVDNPPVPPKAFTYSKSIKVSGNIKLPEIAPGCNCTGDSCVDPDKCSCARLNGDDFPYVSKDGGRLVEAKNVVFECGPNCGCGPKCVNRVSQRDTKYRLEVYRTLKKGWAVRSWDFIPSGAPICEYMGVLTKTEDIDKVVGENDYIFEIDCLQTMRGIDGRQIRDENNLSVEDDNTDEPEFCIDASSMGNVARFINHSCEPNLFVQCALSSHRDFRLARVVLFASDNIRPMQELTYDYGYVLDSVRGSDGKIKQMPCFCGTADCRKRLF